MADLIAFPQNRNIGKARHVAAVWLRRRTQRARDTYWADIVATLEHMLRRRGFAEDEISRQVAGFAGLVVSEIEATDARQHDDNSPGAA